MLFISGFASPCEPRAGLRPQKFLPTGFAGIYACGFEGRRQ